MASSSSHSVKTKAPWAVSEPYFAPMYEKSWQTIMNAMRMGQRTPGAGMNFVASTPGSAMQEASRWLSAGGRKVGQGAQDLANLGRKTAQGGFLPSDQYSMNPQLQNVMDLAAGRTREQFTQGILPNIRDQAIASGAYGGARQDVQENQASQQFARAANEETQKIGYQDYNDFMNRYSQMWNAERNRMQGAGDILQGANQQFMAPGMAKMGQADLLRQERQRKTDNSMQRWMDKNRVAPGFGFNMLPQMAGILTAGDYGTVTEDKQEKTKESSNPLDMFKTGLGALSSIGSLAMK